jgi:hypothetical protein
MMSDNEHTANNRSQPAEPILRPPALHPKPVPCPREQPAMKTHLASIWPGLLAAITLSVLFSAAPAHAHGQYPNMATAPASGILPTAATLNGNVSADSAPATAWFQWGTSSNYGNSTAATNLPYTNIALPVSMMISNLTPNVTYHFCVAASNSYGLATGTDMTFQTPSIFTNLGAVLPGVSLSSVAWGDYDNDGLLDLLLTGLLESGSPISQVYHNNGNGTFSLNTNAVLPGVYYGSVAWGDYDNDGRLDILLTGETGSGSYISQVYHNDGGGNFSLSTNAALPGVVDGSVAWGDYDNDGHLDILLTGLTGFDAEYNPIEISSVYHNNGDGSFTLNTNAVLPGVVSGCAAWGDYDNDGRLDILLTGDTGTQDTNGNEILISRVYHNNGDGSFSLNTNAVLPGVYGGSAAWGDYDNDGRLDILLTGQPGPYLYLSQVYHNNGDGSFSLNTNAVLPGVAYGSEAWGDYDNDGRLDILLTGETGYGTDGYPSGICSVYHNNGDGTFSLNTNAMLPGIYNSSAAWGDYDNDGRLDILLAGQTGSDNNNNPIGTACVYRNLSAITNTPPTAPAGLTAIVSHNNWVSLAWAASSDLQTPAAGLTYNLRIGSTPGGSDLLSPQSDTSNGFRLLPQMGNSELGTNEIVVIPRFPGGVTCYWSAQAVDSAWAGSPFATEGSFFVPGPPDAVTLPAKAITPANATLQGSVNPGGLPTLAWFEWGMDTNYGNFTAQTALSATNTSQVVSAVLGNLTPGYAWHFRMVAANSIGGSIGGDQSFVTLFPPAALTLPAGNISSMGATLNGTVYPNGQAVTAWFQWGLNTNYGNFTSATNLPATNAYLAVSTVLNSLAPGWTYHFCMAVAGSTTTNYGADFAFRTSGGSNQTSGATNFVTSLADGGPGSLRQTIADSEPGDIINFAIIGTISLTNGELEITTNLTIIGPGATNLILSGNRSTRVFDITNANATVTIASLSVCNGQASNGTNGANSTGVGINGGDGSGGGGIYNLGNLTLSNCVLSGNRAGAGGAGGHSSGGFGGLGGTGGHGGGIYSAGLLKLTDCTFATNGAGRGGDGGNDPGESVVGGTGGCGGGVYNMGAISLTACTLSANAAGNGGNSTASGGSGTNGGNGGDGGGIFSAGTITFTACTFSANSAGNGGPGGPGYPSSGNGGNGGNGGGIYISAGAASATLDSDLIALNTTGSGGPAGTDNKPGSAGLAGSGPDTSGAFTSQGFNLVGNAAGSTGLTNGAHSDIVGAAAAPVNPLLASLAENGGDTLTMALLQGSPAIGAGDDSLTGADQRGLPRNSGGYVDIGAFQLQVVPPAVISVACTVTEDAATGLWSASLLCTVNPNGWNTSVKILYGSATNYGSTSALSSIGEGYAAVSTNFLLTGLAPGLIYHYSVVASSSPGTASTPDQTFATVFAVTLPATNITTTQGTLEGAVNPGGLATLAWFEWGTTSNYGNLTAASSLGSGNLALPLSNPLTGLAGGATYHYQVVAFNDLGFMGGADQSFTTRDVSRTITGCTLTAAGRLQFQFTGAAGSSYTVLCSTNLALPLGSWSSVGTVTETSPGQFQFTDPGSKTNQPQRFYLLRQP